MNDHELKQLINSRREIRVGDRVKLLSGAERGCLHGFKNGHVYEVDRIDTTDPCIRLERGDEHIGWARANQLEVVHDA